MLTLDEAAYKNLRERAYNMHRLLKHDGRGGTVVEHFMAVRALLAVMEEHMRQQHGEDAEGIMDHVELWMQKQGEEDEEHTVSGAAEEFSPMDPEAQAELSAAVTRAFGNQNTRVTEETLLPPPPPSDISTIGKCMSPDCSASCRGPFCRAHGGVV